MNRGSFNDSKIMDTMKELLELFGQKITNLLQINLCRDKILAKKRAPTSICSKNNCKSYRIVLKNKYEAISNLVDSVIHF